MTQTVPATCVLGPGKTGLAIGLTVLNLDGTEYAAFATTGVAETSVAGTYRKAGGVVCPDAGGYIVWGVSGTDYAEATVESTSANVTEWKGSTAPAMTGDAYARLGAPAGASVSADVAAVKAQTAAIETDTQDLQTQVGTDGAGLTNLPWNAAWDAEVQSEAADAITAAALATAANLATLAGYVDTEVAAILAAVDTEVAAIKTKTDYLPSATAGSAGGLFIAGANAATSITTALTANITGNLSGSVGSVTGAVGSVTGNVGGSVASVAANGIAATSIASDAINAAAIKADAVTKIQTGLATPTNITAGTITTVTNLTNLPAAAALEATLTAMKGATFSGATDSLEAIRDRGDAAWIAADVSDLPTNSELATALASADDAMLTAIADVPTVAEFEARTLVAASYATAANLATLSGYVDTEVAAILADTNELQTDLTNGGRLDLLIDAIKAKTDNLPAAPAATGDIPSAATIADAVLDEAVVGHVIAGSFSKAVVDILDDTSTALPLAIASITPQSAADIRAEMDTNSTKLAAILADTNELQTDWANGGRLDLILDARASQTSVDDLPTNSELATALSGITASVDQQDIADALLLAPSGAAASGSAMDGLANILEDTGTTIPAAIAGIGGLAGSGAISFPVTINDEDSNPIDGVEVWVSTDSAGTNVVAGTLSTDALGLATFMLDAGTYYVWRQKSGYNFTNPVTITVS